MFKRTILCIALFLIFCNASYSRTVTEKEPNNTSEQANLINLGDTVSGMINYGDGSDYYRLVFPQSGIGTVSISGYPSDCRVMVSISGFHPKYPTATAGSVNSDSGRPLSFSFSATGQKTGYISVSLSSTASGICSGSDWCAVQCAPNGPYYLSPFTDRQAKNIPSTYEGKPVLSPIQYQFNVSLQALPDQYEPNYEEGMSKEQMLQKGLIKTIPIGQEITAYLFNEYPKMMRGTKGHDNILQLGGENDIDIYHIYLSQPDTVRVTLRDFPQNANSKIMLYHSGGWDESKTGATYFEQKVTKPGNVFIEISKGRENRPLVYSTTPYKLLVTTGETTVVTERPYQKSDSERELINNTTLKNLSGWTIHEWYKPSDGKGEVIVESDGVRFKSMSGNHRIGIMQMLNADVSSCSSLVLSATVKADHQTLTGTGWQGREAPVAVFMSYTDAKGIVHNLLSENPNDTARRMFWHGFYYADPVSPSLNIFGTKVQKSTWHNYKMDLMTLNPRPNIIHFVGAEGAGWAQRDGRVGLISLKCETKKYIEQPYQPLVTKVPYYPKSQNVEIFDIKTAKNIAFGQPVGVTDTFMPSDNPIFIYFRFKGIGIGSEIKTVWYYLETENPTVIGEASVALKEMAEYASFHLELGKGNLWPDGNYKIDILVDDIKVKEGTFRVSNTKFRGGDEFFKGNYYERK